MERLDSIVARVLANVSATMERKGGAGVEPAPQVERGANAGARGGKPAVGRERPALHQRREGRDTRRHDGELV